MGFLILSSRNDLTTTLCGRRDEDHLALFIELLGHMPRRICSAGKYAKDYFNRHGELRHIKKLRFWPLNGVLHEKYEFPKKEVRPPPARACALLTLFRYL